MKKRTIVLALLSVLLVMSTLLAGCEPQNDTREYVPTIAIVVTNNLDAVFDELYVYPGDGMTSQDMGPNVIQNIHGKHVVGSYGVTLEVADSYTIIVRDNRGRVYKFYEVALQNVDEAVVSFDEELLCTVYHRGGGSESIVGEYVIPGDAPDHSYVPLRDRVPYDFVIENDTQKEILFVSMREAEDQDKGEVILNAKPLPAGTVMDANGRMFAEDEEITDWVLYMETTDGEKITFETPFNPWTTDSIVITYANGEYSYTAS